MHKRIYDYLEKNAKFDENDELVEYDILDFAQNYCANVEIKHLYLNIDEIRDNSQIELIFESPTLPLEIAMYFYLDDGDLLFDWSEYIFDLSKDEDNIKKDFQEYWTNDWTPYAWLGHIGNDYLVKNNYVEYNEKAGGYQFNFEGKEEF